MDKLSNLFNQYRSLHHNREDSKLTRHFLTKRLQRHDSVIFVAVGEDRLSGFVQKYPTFSPLSEKRA
jgi:hypothetical protein